MAGAATERKRRLAVEVRGGACAPAPAAAPRASAPARARQCCRWRVRGGVQDVAQRRAQHTLQRWRQKVRQRARQQASAALAQRARHRCACAKKLLRRRVKGNAQLKMVLLRGMLSTLPPPVRDGLHRLLRHAHVVVLFCLKLKRIAVCRLSLTANLSVVLKPRRYSSVHAHTSAREDDEKCRRQWSSPERSAVATSGETNGDSAYRCLNKAQHHAESR